MGECNLYGLLWRDLLDTLNQVLNRASRRGTCLGTWTTTNLGYEILRNSSMHYILLFTAFSLSNFTVEDSLLWRL